MSREVLHRVLRATALAASVLAIALLLAGCGGDDDDASDSAAAGTESVATGTEQKGGEESGGEQSGGGDGEGGTADGGGGGAADGGGGTADFGEEAEGADRTGAGEAVQQFLRAWSESDWAEACSLLAAETEKNVAVFAAQFTKSQDCSEQLAALAEELPAKTLPQDERIQVTAVRLEDGRGFVLYRNERGAETTFPVLQEDSAWKVAAIVGSKRQ